MSALVLEALVKSSLLIGCAAGIAMMLRRRGSAAARHLVWTLTIAGLLVLPGLLAGIPRWDLKVPIASAVPATRSRPQALAIVRLDGTAIGAAPGSVASPAPPTVTESATAVTVTGIAAAAVYLLGVAMLLVRLARQRWAISRLVHTCSGIHDPSWLELLEQCARRLNARRSVRLLRSRDEIVPMAFGTRTPSILIPAIADSWDDDRRRAVLLHELAHIVRHDCATQTAAAIACALYWIHPGVWWASSRLRRERELACDDLVVIAGTHANDYASHLLEIAYTCAGRKAPALAVTMARPSEIEGRLRSLLDGARNRRMPAIRARLTSAVAALVAIAIVAAARATLVPVGAQSSNPSDRPTQSAGTTSPRDARARAIAEGRPGTWEIWSTGHGAARVRLSEGGGSSHTVDVDPRQIEAAAPLPTDGGLWRTTLKRDAGSFAVEGLLRRDAEGSLVGAGTFTFAPSAAFPAELMKRGFARPTITEQYLLARSDVGFAFLDELSTQHYARPDLALLVRAAEHGVSLTHVREMGQLGYRLGQVEALVTQVDHGVSPQYVRELTALGLARLSADDLVRTRDHGVDASYVQQLKASGYTVDSVDSAIRARDHGVDPGYVRQMRELGYQTTLAGLINARDHGVDALYVQEIVALGYKGLSLEQLIRLRDHGVDPNYIRELKTIGINSPTPDDLVRLRDSGFTRGRVKLELGYQFQRMRQRLEYIIATIFN